MHNELNFSESEELFFMRAALDEAIDARNRNEVPVGAVVVYKKKIVGVGSNSVINDLSVASHAEINAINMASKILKNYRLKDCILFSTLEPCAMCASAIVHARIRKLYFSAREPKSGAVVSNINFFENNFLNHKVEVHEGTLRADSARLIRAFFREKRASIKS